MNYKTIGKTINLVAKVSPALAQKISFKLFTTPRPRKQKPKEVEFLNTATKKTITVDELQVQTYIWGHSARKILFAHGWESNAGRWRSFIPDLVDAGFEVVAFDAPGHGASGGKTLHLVIYMATIQAIFSELGPFEAIVGHSMGAGAAVMALATKELRHPDKLVLLGSFSEVSEVYRSYAQMLGLSPKLEKEFNKTIKKLSGYNVSYFSVADKASTLTDIKGLVIHDKQDQTIDVNEARNIAQQWALAKYVETDGAGHSLQNRTIFKEVISFLATA
ncbi:MAG TPA: alpha/beta hydrolase [Saprospiraceae bacterium]|nr:alpha/beta hydrolase [Saprospiraceae bacterium]